MVRSAFWSSKARNTQAGTRRKDLDGFKLSLRHSLGLLLHSIGKIPEKGVGGPNLLVCIQRNLLLSRGRDLESRDMRRLLHFCPLGRSR